MDRMFVNLTGDSTEGDTGYKKKTDPPPSCGSQGGGRMGGRDGMARGGTSKVLTVICLEILPGAQCSSLCAPKDGEPTMGLECWHFQS